VSHIMFGKIERQIEQKKSSCFNDFGITTTGVTVIGVLREAFSRVIREMGRWSPGWVRGRRIHVARNAKKKGAEKERVSEIVAQGGDGPVKKFLKKQRPRPRGQEEPPNNNDKARGAVHTRKKPFEKNHNQRREGTIWATNR